MANSNTEDFPFAWCGIAGSNQIARKGAQPCTGLLERWVIPGVFRVAELS